MARLPSTVVALGLVSFFTDLSSDMIYPLLPLFLASTLGAGPQILGVIEGIAECTAALVKLGSGLISDRMRRRKPLVVTGYALASAVRPLIALATSWPLVLVLRFADRVGKGLRASPRDALIADMTEPARWGQAFGLQRAMDHAGAVLGPLVAALLLDVAHLSLRSIFWVAAIPGAIAVLVLTMGVQDKPRSRPLPTERGPKDRAQPFQRGFGVLVAAFVLFTLGNSTDAFLLLRLSEGGLEPATVAVLWSGLHVVKMISTYAGGRLSDRVGRRTLVLTGFGIYSLIYLGFATATSAGALIALFLSYGLYFGFTEPVERAWVSDLAGPEARGVAFGYFHGAIGLAALPASVLFGFIWNKLGVSAAFLSGAGLAALAMVLVLMVPQPTAVSQPRVAP